MCGIVGYIGNNQAAPFLINGLRKLEYRGYDSAGIATINGNDGIRITRVAGRVDQLDQAVNRRPQIASAGIGHTRWATHGPRRKRTHTRMSAGRACWL